MQHEWQGDQNAGVRMEAKLLGDEDNCYILVTSFLCVFTSLSESQPGWFPGALFLDSPFSLVITYTWNKDSTREWGSLGSAITNLSIQDH